MATVRSAWFRARLPEGLDLERLIAVVGARPGAAILESGPGFGDAGRWSFVTAEPRLVFEASDRSWTLRDGRTGHRRHGGAGDVLAALGRFLERFDLAGPPEELDPEEPPFRGGAIGFFGYDLAPQIEVLPRKAPRDSNRPDIRFGLYDWVVTCDHATGARDLWIADLLGEGSAACARRLKERLAVLKRAPGPVPRSVLSPPASNVTRDDYLRAVRRALDYIAAGDIFQVNLSQRFRSRGHADPLDLYLRLRRVSPAPFAALLRGDDEAVVSASPEWFYQTRGDRIVTRPIKGTRPRGESPDDDARLADELRRSAKDRAELTMIVDLERNDLGRIARYGSVRVLDPLVVESYAQVHHLVATVEGRLRPGVGPIEVVRALFPGGSITGAPKIRAMQIIDELEPTRRGLYTGAIGYFGPGGASAFNIAIRTMLLEHDRVSYHVGGGIVSDSDPEAEYEETLHKGRGLRQILRASGTSSE